MTIAQIRDRIAQTSTTPALKPPPSSTRPVDEATAIIAAALSRVPSR